MNAYQVAAVIAVVVILGWPLVSRLLASRRKPEKVTNYQPLMQAIELRSELLHDDDAIQAFDKVIIPVCIELLDGNDQRGNDS